MKNCAASSNLKDTPNAKQSTGKSSASSGKNGHSGSKTTSNRDILKLAKKIGVTEILEDMIQRALE